MLTEKDVAILQPLIRATAHRWARPGLEALDLEQDIWLSIVRLGPKYHLHFRFIQVVAHHAARGSWRTFVRRFRPERIGPWLPQPVTGQVERAVEAALLTRRIEGLPRRSRAAMRLFYGSDLSEAEVARRLGISQHTAQSRISWATRKIRLAASGHK